MATRHWRDLLLVTLIFAVAGLVGCSRGPAPRTVEQTVEAYLQAGRANNQPTVDTLCTDSFKAQAIRSWMADSTWKFLSVKQEGEITAEVLVEFQSGGSTFKDKVMLERDQEWKVSNMMVVR